MRLAQRLLNPVPAGNCKLQTLRQYYRLPERGAHTALGDVGTVADLFATVLRPIAEQRGLETWEQLAAYAAEEWVPSRIAFGQYKGRSIAEARTDAGLRRWLDGLAPRLCHSLGAGAQLGLPLAGGLTEALVMGDQLFGREVFGLLVDAGLGAAFGFHAFVFFKFHRR